MVMPVFTAGRRVRASELKAMADQIDSLTAPGWTSYTPTWTSTGTAPVLNNGTLTGRYRRPAGSDLILVEVRLVIGSTTTIGTGAYFWSVPVTPSATAILTATGSMYIYDTGVLDREGVFRFEDATKLKGVAASNGVVTNTNPNATLNTGDIITGSIWYQPA